MQVPDSGYLGIRVATQCALPDFDHFPFVRKEIPTFARVPVDVGLELGLPEVGVRTWHFQVAVRAAMPEAAMHEYG